ncbi:metallophosphoesterase [Lacticigenium naphthae]|uniref:metallophosphoesterase n=1 Tax=Lacticigenium naphthae TaxID=515351 RepID=UPI00041C7A7E|nr:metallophosphoesterase [Lacticigenium naphthae]
MVGLWGAGAIGLAGMASYLYFQNTVAEVTSYTVRIPHLAQNVKGVKIVHLSDFHLPKHGPNLMKLAEKVGELDPDLIVITGDIVHAGLPDLSAIQFEDFGILLSKMAPVYVVTGNHDIKSGDYESFKIMMQASHVTLLEDKAEWISFGQADEGFVLMGLAEKNTMASTPRPLLKNIQLTEGMVDQPKILLAHHPEYFEEYLVDRTKAPDLTLSGHTHAGQIRMPFVGGLFAPGQGRLPYYDYGLFHSKENPSKRLIINRGLGNSGFPFRINNRPEIGLITLE